MLEFRSTFTLHARFAALFARGIFVFWRLSGAMG